MTVRIKLFDGAEYTVSDQQAEMINQAMTSDQKYIHFEGKTIAVASISHMDSMNFPSDEHVALPAKLEAIGPRWKLDRDKMQFVKIVA